MLALYFEWHKAWEHTSNQTCPRDEQLVMVCQLMSLLLPLTPRRKTTTYNQNTTEVYAPTLPFHVPDFTWQAIQPLSSLLRSLSHHLLSQSNTSQVMMLYSDSSFFDFRLPLLLNEPHFSSCSYYFSYLIKILLSNYSRCLFWKPPNIHCKFDYTQFFQRTKGGKRNALIKKSTGFREVFLKQTRFSQSLTHL